VALRGISVDVVCPSRVISMLLQGTR
jgi:hypothetical protein